MVGGYAFPRRTVGTRSPFRDPSYTLDLDSFPRSSVGMHTFILTGSGGGCLEEVFVCDAPEASDAGTHRAARLGAACSDGVAVLEGVVDDADGG